MSASSAVIATAISQHRNAYISCIVNKADPFNAVTFLFTIIAMLPPDRRPNTADLPPEPEGKQWLDDPDEQEYLAKAWEYVRVLTYKVEEAVAKYVANIQTQRQFG